MSSQNTLPSRWASPNFSSFRRDCDPRVTVGPGEPASLARHTWALASSAERGVIMSVKHGCSENSVRVVGKGVEVSACGRWSMLMQFSWLVMPSLVGVPRVKTPCCLVVSPGDAPGGGVWQLLETARQESRWAPFPFPAFPLCHLHAFISDPTARATEELEGAQVRGAAAQREVNSVNLWEKVLREAPACLV